MRFLCVLLPALFLLQLEKFGTFAFQPLPKLQGPSILAQRRIWPSVQHRPTTCVWQTTTSDQTTQRQTLWNEKYQELVDFQNKHGHLNVAKATKLHNWIHYQRRKYAGGHSLPSLTKEQIRLLNEIGLSWGGGPHAKAWKVKYQELKDFYKKHGHMRVEYQGSLYCWMANQRRKRSNSTQFGYLTEYQIRLLDDISFDWAPTGGTHDMAWYAKYQKLADFYKQHGHLRVSIKSSLFQWKVAQRRKRNRVKHYAPLSNEQIQLLDDLDFQWTDRQGAWDAKYRKLAEFYKQNGHLNVEQGSALYQWKVTQRRKRAGMKRYAPLTGEQIRKLNEIGFR